MKNKDYYTLSPSTLNILEDCPRCFWLHFNENIRRPTFPFPSLPSGIDRVLKDYYDSYRAKKKLPPELEELRGAKLYDDVEKLDEWRSFGKGLRWKDKKNNIIRGTIDDLLEKDGKLIVVDYKTRGFPLKEDTADYYKMQLHMYNFLLEKNGQKTHDYSYLIFYRPEKVRKSRIITFNTDLVKVETSAKDAEKFLKKALKTLKGDMPERSEECGYCKWAEENKTF